MSKKINTPPPAPPSRGTPASIHVPRNFTANDLKVIIAEAEVFAHLEKQKLPAWAADVKKGMAPIDGKITLKELKAYVAQVKKEVGKGDTTALYKNIVTAWKDGKTLESDFKFIADQTNEHLGIGIMSDKDVDKLVQDGEIRSDNSLNLKKYKTILS